jgi:predicted ATPase
MPMSREMRLLDNKWSSNQGWPKRLEWLEIRGLRGWTGQRIDFDFPITAIVGENGVGKSTVLQAAASIYQNDGVQRYASDFFPDTTWDEVRAAEIVGSIREGAGNSTLSSVRKPTGRWRGNPERKERFTAYIDLKRIQPLYSRTGYGRLANPQIKEAGTNNFANNALERLSGIMGKSYSSARMALTDADTSREIPVLQKDGKPFSGFHSGAGEIAITELMKETFYSRKNSLVLIDEVETSLHPRVQRRFIRDLAAMCRETESQVILTTHSPYVLQELPSHARIYLMNGAEGKQVVRGVSPEFAMTQMDEDRHPEVDVYVEDKRAEDLLREIVVAQDRELIKRVQIVAFGAASVGLALGQMITRFPRPSIVFLDGDQPSAPGCEILPGQDAPERVVF